jgi:hypothetical protein
MLLQPHCCAPFVQLACANLKPKLAADGQKYLNAESSPQTQSSIELNALAQEFNS